MKSLLAVLLLLSGCATFDDGYRDDLDRGCATPWGCRALQARGETRYYDDCVVGDASASACRAEEDDRRVVRDMVERSRADWLRRRLVERLAADAASRLP